MNSKERAYLKKEANSFEAIYQVGKNGVEETLIKGIDEALRARELIKVSMQESSEYTTKELSKLLASKLKAEVVQVIGRRIILYKRNPEINKYGV